MSNDNESSNNTVNRPFRDIMRAHLSRRTVVAGGLAMASTAFFAGGLGAVGVGDKKKPLINFTPVSVAEGKGPVPTISPEYQFQVLIPWGEPIQPGGPAFSYPPNAADQAKQIGIGHDGMRFFPLDDHDDHGRNGGRRESDHGILAINHEFGENPHVLGKPAPLSLDDVRASQHAHGVSVVEIKKIKGVWQTVKSKKARRIHANTPMKFSGPAAGHPLLKTKAGNHTLGTLNNCANGFTPWDTYLTCEENFNGFFAAGGAWTPTDAQKRYGFSAGGFDYQWHKFDPRFDLANGDYANEENRFGWVVEIDPMNPKETPVKRTALGRVKHEGATVVEGDGGRIVVYMGDDEANDYIYKFVSEDNWRRMRSRGKSPLDHGKLYVARFNEDGSGDWLELTIKNPTLAAKFPDQGALLVHTRIAADLIGATPMDRPEWTTVAPNGDVYCTLTNNSGRVTPNPPTRWRRTRTAISSNGATAAITPARISSGRYS